jgi:hypothetical protein
MHRQHLFSDIFNMQIMRPARSWSYKMVFALRLYINMLINQCGRERMLEEERWLKLINSEELDRFCSHCTNSRKDSNHKKYQFDAAWIANFAPVELMKAQVRTAMIDYCVTDVLNCYMNKLFQIVVGVMLPVVIAVCMRDRKAMLDLQSIAAYATNSPMSEHLKHAATTAIVTIIYLNGFAGRSFEWNNAKKVDVFKQLDAGKNWIACKYHKTFKHYGEVINKQTATRIHFRCVGLLLADGCY